MLKKGQYVPCTLTKGESAFLYRRDERGAGGRGLIYDFTNVSRKYLIRRKDLPRVLLNQPIQSSLKGIYFLDGGVFGGGGGIGVRREE